MTHVVSAELLTSGLMQPYGSTTEWFAPSTGARWRPAGRISKTICLCGLCTAWSPFHRSSVLQSPQSQLPKSVLLISGFFHRSVSKCADDVNQCYYRLRAHHIVISVSHITGST